jgi:hypothetical protein
MRQCSSIRLKFVLLVAIVAAALVAVPTALGGKPVRAVITPGPGVFPAGFGCAFDVGVLPNSPTRITQFSDGRTVTQVNAEPTFTNLDTGESFVNRTRFTATETYDPVSNDILDVGSGRFVLEFFPGDQGPYGVIGNDGGLFVFAGTATLTFDLDTGQITSFSYAGTVTDLCALRAA